MRVSINLYVDKSLLAEIAATKGDRSTSERVNQLLARALKLERQDALEREAALFYSGTKGRLEEHSLQKASQRSIARS